MKILTRSLLMLLCAGAATGMSAQDEMVPVPQGSVIINGGPEKPLLRKQIWDALFAPSDWHFEVQQAPRFLFVDKEGKVAFGIGGLVKGTLQYDFDGSCDGNDEFIPYNIPVPADPTMRNSFNGTVNDSKLYARLVGHSHKLGTYSAYIEAKFSGGSEHKTLELKQAWVSLGYLRAGKITSIFNDDDAQPFTVDEQGPNGASCGDDVGLQWTPRFGKGDAWTGAIGVSVLSADYTTGDEAQAIAQRAPEVPVYLQYSWADHASRVRVSAIWRNLSYRDDLLQQNKSVNGWGVMLSGVVSDIPNLTLSYQCLYGKGVARYINDLSGNGFDLIPSTTDGRLTAPGALGWYGAAQYDFSEKFFMTGTYSQARLFDQSMLGGSAYRYGQYLAVNAIWEPVLGLRLGVEYDWGRREDLSRVANHANRIALLGSYSF